MVPQRTGTTLRTMGDSWSTCCRHRRLCSCLCLQRRHRSTRCTLRRRQWRPSCHRDYHCRYCRRRRLSAGVRSRCSAHIGTNRRIRPVRRWSRPPRPSWAASRARRRRAQTTRGIRRGGSDPPRLPHPSCCCCCRDLPPPPPPPNKVGCTEPSSRPREPCRWSATRRGPG